MESIDPERDASLFTAIETEGRTPKNRLHISERMKILQKIGVESLTWNVRSPYSAF